MEGFTKLYKRGEIDFRTPYHHLIPMYTTNEDEQLRLVFASSNRLPILSMNPCQFRRNRVIRSIFMWWNSRKAFLNFWFPSSEVSQILNLPRVRHGKRYKSISRKFVEKMSKEFDNSEKSRGVEGFTKIMRYKLHFMHIFLCAFNFFFLFN